MLLQIYQDYWFGYETVINQSDELSTGNHKGFTNINHRATVNSN